MFEITIIEEKTRALAGMRRRGHYKKIAEMLPDLFEYAVKADEIKCYELSGGEMAG